MPESVPTKKELYATLKLSNLNPAAGSGGINGLIVYKECWSALGDSLHDVGNAVFACFSPTVSMREQL